MTGRIGNLVPSRAQLRDDIMRSVLAKHELGAKDFFSEYRDSNLVAARRDAAKQLHAAGFAPLSIARIIKRNRSTVDHYIYNYTGKKRERARILRALERVVPRDISDVVGEIAAAEGVSPVMLVAQWISERATYEASAKARDAA
jgi:hypothetical protein